METWTTKSPSSSSCSGLKATTSEFVLDAFCKAPAKYRSDASEARDAVASTIHSTLVKSRPPL
eukprot:scaffold2532_cov243-Pinguiococcus_pyrenoidosus.AAC.3